MWDLPMYMGLVGSVAYVAYKLLYRMTEKEKLSASGRWILLRVVMVFYLLPFPLLSEPLKKMVRNLSDRDILFRKVEDILPIFQNMTGHGTGIASIIAANGENDIKGINPDVEVYSVKILDKENSATLSRVIRGIYWCIENNINIINMSFGTNVYSAALEQAVKDAYNAGILMIGAAGNEGESVEYPAAFEEVMAVVATDEEANISDFSNRGDELEIAAPGEKVKVSGFFDGTSVTHGTSIAVPHVVGVASLVWEKI